MNQMTATEVFEQQDEQRQQIGVHLTSSRNINQLLKKLIVRLMPLGAGSKQMVVTAMQEGKRDMPKYLVEFVVAAGFVTVIFIMIAIIWLILRMFECRCQRREPQDEEEEGARYFCDDSRVYHTKENCTGLRNAAEYQTRRLCKFCLNAQQKTIKHS